MAALHGGSGYGVQRPHGGVAKRGAGRPHFPYRHLRCRKAAREAAGSLTSSRSKRRELKPTGADIVPCTVCSHAFMPPCRDELDHSELPRKMCSERAAAQASYFLPYSFLWKLWEPARKAPPPFAGSGSSGSRRRERLHRSRAVVRDGDSRARWGIRAWGGGAELASRERREDAPCYDLATSSYPGRRGLRP